MPYESTQSLCEKLIEKYPDYMYTETFKRHLKDIKNLDPKLYRFNEKIADTYLMVLESFRHSKGEKANELIELEDWQKAAIKIAFGWETLNEKNKWVRRFNTVLFFMARKQGKSLLSAALAVTDSLIRQQYGSEIAMIATKTDQAKLVWNEIHEMVFKHPDLKKKFRKAGNKLFSKIDNGQVYPLGRDAKTLDGLNISIIVADEIHAMANSDLIDVCKSSQGAREEPLSIYISTAGFNLASPLVPEIEHARNIFKGNVIDENYFAFLAEPNQDDEPYSLESLKKSNPNIGVSVSESYLIKQMEDAKNRPELRVNYLTKYLNTFVNAAEEFIPIKEWRKCKAPEDYEVDFENIKSVLVGCDLSTNDDLTALVTGYLDYDDNLYIETEVFLPEERIEELSRRYRAPLEEWIKAGYLQTTKGTYIDYNEIYKKIVEKIELAEDNNVEVEVYYDAYKFKQIKASLENELGFKEAYPVKQGFITQTEPLALMINYIHTKKISYLNSPVMNWAMSNVVVVTDGYGNTRLDKSSHFKKIDPVAALANIFYGLIPKVREEEPEYEILYL